VRSPAAEGRGSVEGDAVSRRTAEPGFRRLVARVAERAVAERLVAEAWDAGASGVEEQEEEGGIRLIVYAPAAAAPAVARAAAAAVAPGDSVGSLEAVEEADWSERWKDGLAPVEVSPRLRVRASFASAAPAAGRRELVVDPGQAFGTGGHASTRLALEWIDRLAPELGPESRVLDVGTGTGVLALAALLLGAGRAVGFDLDPAAAREARACAAANGLAGRFRVFTGPLEALRAAPFDLVAANLLRSELLPLAAGIASRLRAGGALVVSGMLESESAEVAAAFATHGVRVRGERTRRDPTGDTWSALWMQADRRSARSEP
jgi:ribosomal protein L11 methyltransferase